MTHTRKIAVPFLISLVPNIIFAYDGPIQIFLLAGQSNMEGMGSLEHLKLLLEDNKTRNEYQHLWDEEQQDWKENPNNVYIKFEEQIGLLKAGLGAGEPYYHIYHRIGPELEFGWALGDYYASKGTNSPILLLKVAFGGQDLAVDFRPPLSGIGNYSKVDDPNHYGWKYRDMIRTVQHTLSYELPLIIPDLNKTSSYCLTGMVWFQGWNDHLNMQKVKEYEYNLANLIRSVRFDLDAPDLPVVIGEFGASGVQPTGRGSDRTIALRQAQQNVTQSEEFRDSTVYVRTAQYVVANGTSYDGGYHYYGRADTYCDIGEAFGKAMIELMENNPVDCEGLEAFT